MSSNPNDEMVTVDEFGGFHLRHDTPNPMTLAFSDIYPCTCDAVRDLRFFWNEVTVTCRACGASKTTEDLANDWVVIPDA